MSVTPTSVVTVRLEASVRTVSFFVVLGLVGAACSAQTAGRTSVAEVEPAYLSTTSTVPTSTNSGPHETEPESEKDRQRALVEDLGLPGLKQPGRYQARSFSVEATVESDVPFKVSLLADRFVVLESNRSNTSSYEALAMVEADVFVVADRLGSTIARLPVSLDLGPWIQMLDHSSLVDQGVGEVGGRSAAWWTIKTDTDCDDCWYELFSVGELSWWTRSGSTHKIWAVEVKGSIILLDLESPSGTFEEWDRVGSQVMLGGIEFGERRVPVSLPDPLSGPHHVSRLEVTIVDETRSTNEVNVPNEQFTATRVAVPASPARTLPVSIVYPSKERRYGSEALPGSFPLVVVAHSLGGSGAVDHLDELLASHGYIVARVQFPESSLPGNSYQYVSEQPGDVSFAISQLLDEAVLDGLGLSPHGGPVGLIGYSLGATTVYGLMGADCCLDSRVGAAVAHAGTFHDFDGALDLADAALLIIGSEKDEILANVDLLETFGLLGESGEIVNFPSGSHLEWLDPTSSGFVASFEATVHFLDVHLKDG